MYTKGNHKQKDNPQNGKKYLQTDQQGINLQNIQTAHAAPYKKQTPIKKWVQDLKRHFQRIHTDGQQEHDKILNISNY